ncbi:hypothetical protein BVRB_6g134200 [Beta vulgaris subsp. vulgaris]|nr:hypothetical protein BVRB_6g134200 [Beta vulgaris subsp. vulgaris]
MTVPTVTMDGTLRLVKIKPCKCDPTNMLELRKISLLHN